METQIVIRLHSFSIEDAVTLHAEIRHELDIAAGQVKEATGQSVAWEIETKQDGQVVRTSEGQS